MSVVELVLGLDLGARSIGWALIEFQGDNPVALRAAGVRIFEAGVEGSAADLQKGAEESRAAFRRMMRMQRRQFDRRGRRDKLLALTLQSGGLLPEGDLRTGVGRHALITALDRELFLRHGADLPEEIRHQVANVFPYWLRARALDGKCELHEIGRALYHLGQRRGFLSNRRAGKKSEEKGPVYKGISELREAIEGTGCRSLGEYFSQLNPTAYEPKRIRGRWTHRSMFEREFERIWETQSAYWPHILTKQLKKRVRRTIFYQRPLKSAKELVGECRFETAMRTGGRARKRCPMSDELAQHFRMWQAINHLRIEGADLHETALTDEQRQALFEALDRDGDMTFAQVKKLLGLKGERFTIERGGENKFRGNRVRGAMRKIFGEAWDHFSEEKRAGLLQDLRSYERSEALEKRARKHWGMDPVTAEEFSRVELEDKYSSLSRQAITKLLPHLKAGKSYGDAVYAAYGVYPNADGTEGTGGTPLELRGLPPVNESALRDLRNPAVHRVLSELRKVVNALVKRHGKPVKIRIELARDLRNSRSQREKIWKRQRVREAEREEARDEIEGSAETNIQNPRRGDIERFLLWKECGGVCPYTGKQISMAALYGAQFDVEHIIPYSLCLDNSFANKTLCYHELNRCEKKNQTPWQAFGSTGERWEAMLDRVRRFSGDPQAVKRKLARFSMNDTDLAEYLSHFGASQLQDTRYATKLAAQYVRQLYQDEDGLTQRVQGTNGSLTAELRGHWQMNKILGGGEKTRDDHRHHAVDAIAVALTTPKLIKRVSDAAVRNVAHGQRVWKDMPAPWEGFLEECIRVVEGIVVSHAVDGRVSGALHEQTNYSAPYQDAEGETWVKVRKPVAALSKPEVEQIVDPVVRARVQAALGGGDPKKVFQRWEDHPFLVTAEGRRVPIHRVRVRAKKPVFAVGRAERERFVVSGQNHHVEIFECTDKKGKVYWDARVLSLFEVTEKKREARLRGIAFDPVERVHPAGGKFLFSLVNGDVVEMDGPDGERGLYVVRGFSTYTSGQTQIQFIGIRDARPISQVPKTGRAKDPDPLRKLRAQKVRISPLGEVFPAHY